MAEYAEELHHSLVEWISDKTGHSKRVVTGRKRVSDELSDLRHIAWHILLKYTDYDHVKVGRLYNRDRSTIYHGLKAVERKSGLYQDYSDLVSHMERQVL